MGTRRVGLRARGSRLGLPRVRPFRPRCSCAWPSSVYAASGRSVVAYTAAPVFLAIITDRVISVIRRHVLPLDTESAWAWLGRFTVACLKLAGVVALYGLRTVVAPRSTLFGLRRMVLDAAPVPGLIELEPVVEEPALPGSAGAPALPAATCHIWVPSTGEASGDGE